MPLLKKKELDKVHVPEYLRDDEEVFYCEITNEIFRDYEEFSERMFLCNSMVWTCAMTGKSNLTYNDALESERNAIESLKLFPDELKIPVLYLSSITRRTGFCDVVEDVFNFIKDRYFIGENVETCFSGNKWKDSHVLQVIPPTEKELKSPRKDGHIPSAALYKYEIEHVDGDDKDISEMMIVDWNHIRRKKGLMSRDKIRKFLKQCLKQDDNSVFILKSNISAQYKLDEIKFEDIFNGPIPKFAISKRINGKKTKQETIIDFLAKHQNNTNEKKGNGIDLIEAMKKKTEKLALLKKKKEEEKLALKDKQKKERIAVANQIKDWYKPKEDLELEDQKPLPELPSVALHVPGKHVGDVLMICEFVQTFSTILHAKTFFPNGLTVEIIDRAFTETELAGPLSDLVQMLLTTIFVLQDEEAALGKICITTHYGHQDFEAPRNILRAARFASLTYSSITRHQGVPLRQLPLDIFTVSEVLRLHLLTSGAITNEAGAKWRFQERGGYMITDDPGLHLRVNTPDLMDALTTQNLVELSFENKLKICNCLIDQILTYASVRDSIEEMVEKNKQLKIDLKSAHMVEKKREMEYQPAKNKVLKGADSKNELEKFEDAMAKKKHENEKKIDKLEKLAYKIEVYCGQDRAFRNYWKLGSVPGIFVEHNAEYSGYCYEEQIIQNKNLIDATKDDIKKYLTNDLKPDNNNSTDQIDPENLLMCSSNPEHCSVHTFKHDETKWSFIETEEQLNGLIENLNRRGFRESELKQNLEQDKERLLTTIVQTPHNQLDINLGENTVQIRKLRNRYDDSNLGYSLDTPIDEVLHNLLVDNILDLEEKMHTAHYGKLLVEDRDRWRRCLKNKDYNNFDRRLIKREQKSTSDTEQTDNILPANPAKNSDEKIDENELIQSSELTKQAITNLTAALAQISESIQSHFLRRPLGKMGRDKSSRREDLLPNWQRSLLASTSFSQVFLHYCTLDACIMWQKLQLIRCQICHKYRNSDCMLLCDLCDLGFHTFCLKPKILQIPDGDWFCDKCLKHKQKDNVQKPQRCRLFQIKSTESVNDEEEKLNGHSTEPLNEDGGNEENDMHRNGELPSDDKNEEDKQSDERSTQDETDICDGCGYEGELLTCEHCFKSYHVECANPPLRHFPRGAWYCHVCREKREQRNRRRRHSDSEDEDENDEVIHTRSHRRDFARNDLPLHNSALQELLSDIMKDNDAWPFLRPVQKNEVPDYYDVIKQPMDFGTIKYKLNMGEYSMDAQLMNDVVLVFENCNMYNHSEDEVYKCGVRLLKRFQEKCEELGLDLPRDLINGDSDEEQKPKKRRIDKYY